MHVVGIGGTVSPSSSSDRALRIALDRVGELGMTTRMFGGDFLKQLPMYDPTDPVRTHQAVDLVRELRAADAVILSAAAYHGSISGMLKNALDYTEDMVADDRIYFADLPVGIITVAKGWQAGANTLSVARAITHALRGWPTPYGCVINTARNASSPPGHDPVADSVPALHMVAQEVVLGAERLGAVTRAVAVS